MPRRRYTEAEKAEALDLWQSVGAAETARQTGIATGTIASWANRADLATMQRERTSQAIEDKRQKWEDRRLVLVHQMGEVAEEALAAARRCIDEGKAQPSQQFTTTMAILVDKAQLLAGGVTSRTETLSGSAIDAEVQRLSAELDLMPQAVER